MLTLHSPRLTPSPGAEKVSAPPVRKGPSKDWFTRTIRTLRSGVLETSQGRVDRRMRICHIKIILRRDDSREAVEMKAGMKFRTINFHEDGF